MNPNTPERVSDAASQVLMATPSVAAVTATKIFGLEIDSWLGLAGIGFLMLQAAYLIWRWRRDIDVENDRVREARSRFPTDQE